MSLTDDGLRAHRHQDLHVEREGVLQGRSHQGSPSLRVQGRVKNLLLSSVVPIEDFFILADTDNRPI